MEEPPSGTQHFNLYESTDQSSDHHTVTSGLWSAASMKLLVIQQCKNKNTYKYMWAFIESSSVKSVQHNTALELYAHSQFFK